MSRPFAPRYSLTATRLGWKARCHDCSRQQGITVYLRAKTFLKLCQQVADHDDMHLRLLKKEARNAPRVDVTPTHLPNP